MKKKKTYTQIQGRQGTQDPIEEREEIRREGRGRHCGCCGVVEKVRGPYSAGRVIECGERFLAPCQLCRSQLDADPLSLPPELIGVLVANMCSNVPTSEQFWQRNLRNAYVL